jgi:hypothetical protein
MFNFTGVIQLGCFLPQRRVLDNHHRVVVATNIRANAIVTPREMGKALRAELLRAAIQPVRHAYAVHSEKGK